MDKLSTAYQMKKQSFKTNLRLKSVHIIKRSEDKDDLKSIKVYKFNNTKENWHVQIVQSDDGKIAWLGQPTIIKSLEKQF